MRSYTSIDQLDIDKVGPCLVAGHPKEHKMDMNPCWMTMRSYLHDNSFADYIRAVNRKK
jgi:hypothetical protein